ncbi:MAG TPA: nucleoside triphosphate pyrophosphohydrolase [Treponemataceae bacterium]|jgi:tetrapyrrole methylase family protein/MazG family protein|nr:MAG: Nucleoside triphosphate pyrophosphohydrolase/pyrophosphatase MazG [Spirochaetes bacterium ADurb.Bin215]HPA10079.1 nucleoside triphosphate pyrophosphohydrolase [Treponemataceae bacterium]
MSEHQNDAAAARMEAFNRLHETIRRLRAPGGCPWDREQTPETLRETLIEEAYETVEAITEGDTNHVCEELGDVFLNAVMLSYMYEQLDSFTVTDVLETVSDKLIRRHPHVFGETDGYAGPGSGNETDTPEKVLNQWDEIKQKVEGRKGSSALDGVSMGLPSLERAKKLQKRASKCGFDWEHSDDVWPKVDEELAELREAAAGGNPERIEEELGDVLFSLVNIARHLKVDPGVALTRTNAKFVKRFTHVESSMKEAGLPMDKDHLADMDRFWNELRDSGRTER